MKNRSYFIYAIVVTAIVTIICWVNLVDSWRITGDGGSGRGGYRGNYGGSVGGSGGHK